MRQRRKRQVVLMVSFTALAIGCAGHRAKAPHVGIAPLWRDFLEMEPQRAMAIAGEPDGVWVGAVSGGHDTRLDAEQSVLAECRRSRANRRMQAACRLYATGSEIVWKRR
ncbi:MAG: hypothetical protein ACE5FL_08455 [Myxococcota bacterium]